jgi:uncharacterized protein YgiM (DUF1202 family)
MKRRLPVWLILGLLVVLPTAAATLQGGTCPPLVERALNEAGRECANLPRNSACYGFNQVSAQFSTEIAEGFFSQPADTAELTTLQSISTAALDEALGRWGVAVLNVQANLPNSLPGQGVRFILFGESVLENAVPADQAVQAVTPVAISVTTAANLRSGPSRSANILGSAPAGTTLQAEGVSPDGAWLRVNSEQVGLAWVALEVITTEGDLSSLPVVTASSRSPMQAFQFRTGLGQISCEQAPSALMIQGPQGFQVSIEANGASITFGSTILLRASDARMRVTTLEGQAIVEGLTLPAGYSIEAPLDADGEAGFFEGMAQVSEDELADWDWLEEVPVALLEYELEVPTLEQIEADASILNSPSDDDDDDADDDIPEPQVTPEADEGL